MSIRLAYLSKYFASFLVCCEVASILAQTEHKDAVPKAPSSTEKPTIPTIISPDFVGPRFSPQVNEIVEGMFADLGSKCEATPKQKGPTQKSLEKANREVQALIYQFAIMSEEEKADKEGGIQIGPPAVMSMMMTPEGRKAFYNYRSLKQNRRGSNPPKDRDQQVAKFESDMMNMLATVKPKTDIKDIRRAGEIAYNLGQNRNRFQYPRKGTPIPIPYIGTPSNSAGYFSSVDGMKNHLLGLHKHLTSLDKQRKNEELALNAVIGGLVSGGLTLGIEGTRRFVHSNRASVIGVNAVVSQNNAGQEFAAGAGLGASATVWSTLTKDITGYLTGQIKGTATTEAQSMLSDASASLNASMQNSQKALEQSAEYMKLLEKADDDVEAQSQSIKLGVTNPNFVATAEKFAESMFMIRKVSTELLRTPSLIDAIQLKSASSSGPATRLAIQDSRESNNLLLKSLQGFDNAGQSLDAALKKALTVSSAKSADSGVSTRAVEESLEPFYALMLHNMDGAVDELSNQRKNYHEAMNGIQKACDSDQQAIYDKWGEDMPWLSHEADNQQAYLAKTILARSDCVHKRSMVRSAEIMKIATTIAQIQGNCTQVKTWDNAVQLYPKLKSRLK